MPRGVSVTLLLGAAGGIWLSQVFLYRVDAISRTAEAIIDGDLTQRVPLRGTGDDLDRLAETLNRMLDRMDRLLESVRQASNNIAHDLRTPLTRLGQRLEEARTQVRSADGQQRALDAAKAEVDALLGTFAALLRIAEVEAGAQRAAFRRVDLSAVVATVAEAFAPSAEEAGYTLVAEVAPGIAVHGDRELLTQALVNLVENALRHTPPGTQVRLLLRAQAGRAVMAVEDNGPGIPEAERDQVLRRFYRLDHSRSTPGSGLGLSLVAAVAELHGAELRLEDAKPGLRVVINLSRAAQPLPLPRERLKVDSAPPRPYPAPLDFPRNKRVMRIRNSLRAAKVRDKNCRVVRRRGRVYVINKKNPRMKCRQG